MPIDRFHGVRASETASGVRPIDTADVSTVAFVATSDDADADLFPLDQPVAFTDIRDALNGAGDQGTLGHSLDAISDQCSPKMVVVRVAEGATEAETISNVIGGNAGGQYTGLQALRTAQTKAHLRPSIIGVPGLDSLAVTTEAISVANDLDGFVYASCYGSNTKEEAVTYRDGVAGRNAMLLWPNFISWDTVASADREDYAVARALGLRAKIDRDVGWHKTLSNVAVQGVTGLSRDVAYDLTAESSDNQYLNAAEVTTLIQDEGFYFWGSRTCSPDPMFLFENYTRTAQVLKRTMVEAHKWALQAPLHPTLAQDLLEGVRAKLQSMVDLGYLIGAEVWIDPALNTKERLYAGKFKVSYNYTPVPPLEDLTFVQTITDTHLFDFTARMAA